MPQSASTAAKCQRRCACLAAVDSSNGLIGLNLDAAEPHIVAAAVQAVRCLWDASEMCRRTPTHFPASHSTSW